MDSYGEQSDSDTRFSDSENDDLRALQSSKSPSDLFSGVYRGFKKITPGREDLARLTRQSTTHRNSPPPPSHPTHRAPTITH
ncbi:hypothetical protein SCUCBS95973_007210 [Sporothrix curviconia]|uniref:Uncharacterized protein n=1 Tax=Sporothrix curviconia TaxID=1260050 RepID=A0ABP0CE46_9PEZI